MNVFSVVFGVTKLNSVKSIGEKRKSFKRELTDATHNPLVCDGGNEVGVDLGAAVPLWLHHVVGILIKDNGWKSEIPDCVSYKKKGRAT